MPGGTTPGGGSGTDAEQLRQQLQRLANEGLKRVSDALKAVGDISRAALDYVRQLWKEGFSKVDEGAAKATEKLKATTAATKDVGKSAKEAAADVQKLGIAGELVAGIFGAVFFGAVSRVANALSGLLAPNVEAITGGLARMDEAARRVQVATRDLAIEVEQGQQRALAPFRNAIASIYERLLALDPALVQTAAEMGQVGSVVLGLVGTVAKLSAAFVTWGVALIGLLQLLPRIGGLIGVNLTNTLGGLATLVRWFYEQGLIAFGGAWRTALAFLLPWRGVILAITAALGVAAAAWIYFHREGSKAAETLSERLERLKQGGSEALIRQAESWQNLTDKIKQSISALRAQREIDAALGRGDTAAAAAIQRRLALEEQELRNRKRFEEITQQIIDQHGRARAEAEAEAAAALRTEQHEEAITKLEQIRREELSHRLQIMEFGESLLQRELTIEQRLLSIDEQRAAVREKTIANELRLAQDQNASPQRILDLQGKLIAAQKEQGEQQLSQIEVQRRGATEQARDLDTKRQEIERTISGTAAGRARIEQLQARRAEIGEQRKQLEEQKRAIENDLASRKAEQARRQAADLSRRIPEIKTSPTVPGTSITLRDFLENPEKPKPSDLGTSAENLAHLDRLKRQVRDLESERRAVKDQQQVIEESQAKLRPELEGLARHQAPTEDEANKLKDIAMRKKEIAAIDAELAQRARAILQDNTALVDAQVRLLALKRQQLSLDEGVRGAEERVRRIEGRFDPRDAFREAEKEFEKNIKSRSPEDLEKARLAAERLERFAEETGDYSSRKRAVDANLELAKKEQEFGKERLKQGEKDVEQTKDVMESLQAYGKEASKASDMMKPMETMTVKIGGNIKSWKGYMEDNIGALSRYLELYRQVGGVVEAAPGRAPTIEVSSPNPLKGTPDGVATVPPTTTSPIRRVEGPGGVPLYTNL